MLNTIKFLIFLFLFFPFWVWGEEETRLKALRDDCRAEGEAMGMQKAQLDRYIAECVADFEEAEMANSIKLKK